MEDKFLQRFFPASKATKLQSEINHFIQKPHETLYDAWTRFGKMLRNCPQHGLNNFNKVQIFYKGVNVSTRKEIDIAAGGSLMKKTSDEASEIISETATHSYDCHQEMDVSRSSHVTSTETSHELASVKAQLATFKRQMESITKEMHAIKVGCELCQGSHLTKDFDQASMEEHANYVGYVKKGDFPLSEFSGGRHFFNQAGNTSGNNYQNGNQVYQGNQKVYPYRPPGLNNRNQQAPPRNLQQPMMSLSERPPGTLPSNTQSNPNNKGPVRNERVNAITTRSGLVLNEETLKSPPIVSPTVLQAQEQKKDDPPEVIAKPPLKVYKAPIPYLKALKKDKLANQYKKFLDIINQISINMPLAEVIRGMPNYGKFLKDLISSKGKYQEVSATFLNEVCSAILQKQKMPLNLGDPCSFIIPCLLGDSVVYDALADLGASVNLMPYSWYLKLGLGDLKLTRMGICLANHSFDTPIGIAKDLINQLSIGVGDERVIFHVDKARTQPKSNDITCFKLHLTDLCVENDVQDSLKDNVTGCVSVGGSDDNEVDFEKKEDYQLMTIRVNETKCENKGNIDEWLENNVTIGNVIDHDTWEYDGRFEDVPDDVDSEVISDEYFGEFHE
ncbi:uncharacterized protein [Rutidosis leptorrhynchoides]|uniref:uncharacterized protein n=1 Tax=Rutidosis leptorrhynchoides TaxID=125765 RepID=UPI003A9A4741